MSDHHAAPDRKPAFMGLIFGAIAIFIIVFTVSKLTARKYAGEGKPTASAVR